ncbi:MAG TPA: hypothetical protein VN948_13710 [Terriglobales bacterium]|nr:hypothetical protein [Terriglobales bacterium]
MAESHKPGAHNDLEHQIISAQEKPALDEATFQQLLEAAHVIQDLKAFEVANLPRPDPADALAKIVETQELLRSQPSDLRIAARVIAERLQEITHATGVAIAVVRENQLEYSAATGDAASLAGSRLPIDSSLSADGQLSTEFVREVGDKSSMALPLHHEGKLAGLLEIRFADADSIQEPEIRSCQLMAGLMTEAIARATDREWRQTLAAERAAMLEALERIKPQLERLAVESVENLAKPAGHVVESAESVVEPAAEAAESRATIPISDSGAKSSRNTICPQCGYQFGEQELFCGRCGTARPAGTLPSGDLQSKWASLWHLRQAAENKHHEETGKDSEETETGSYELTPELSPELKKVIAQFSDKAGELEAAPESDSGLVIGDAMAEDTAPVSVGAGEPPKSPSPWTSATKTQEWLDSLNPKSVGGIWLAKHRADIYVGAAAVLLLIVLSGWVMRPAEHPVQSKNPPQPSLTLFDKLLLNLGLAETPPAPVYLGNPNAQVWVDLHTALYYCSDSDLYGKTPGGKFTTQRDAQLDQFEPAARKNCD